MNSKLNITIPMLATMLLAAICVADVIELRSDAMVSNSSVRLKDVAKLVGEHANKLADVELATLNRGETTLTMATVKRVLNERGVNWGRLSCRGAMCITVRRVDKSNASLAAAKTAAKGNSLSVSALPVGSGGAAANPLPTINTEPIATLRQQIVRWIQSQIQAPLNDIRIEFENDIDKALEMTDADQQFEIKSLSHIPIGRVPIMVRRYRDRQPIGEHRILVDVKVRRTVVVATRSISRNRIVTESDVRGKSIWLNSMIKQPIIDISQVVGQRSAGVLRAGAVIYPNDISSPVMVRRGQLVTVRCVSGALVVKTVARAMGEGGIGQFITVRNERTRKKYQARITGPQEVVLAVGAATDASQLASKGVSR